MTASVTVYIPFHNISFYEILLTISKFLNLYNRISKFRTVAIL